MNNAIRSAEYLIPEATYGYDHPEVLYWTKTFLDNASSKNVFANIRATIENRRSEEAARAIAEMWYDFTRFVPTFISKAVVLATDPEWQHHFIQIAYDELGGKNKDHLHSKLFLDMLSSVWLEIDTKESKNHIAHILAGMYQTMSDTRHQHAIIGLLLSFEIIAEENIETLFEGLCYKEDMRDTLSESKFFKIHRQDETEHIRHSIANYLRFCKTPAEKAEFQKAFNDGIDFWLRFWDQMARVVLVVTEPQKLRA